MKKRRIILLVFMLMLLLSISISTFAFLSQNSSMSLQLLIRNMLYNMPIFLLMGLVDYAIFQRLEREKKDGSIPYIKSNFIAMVGTPLLFTFLFIPLSYLLSFPLSLTHNILPATLCNGIIVLFIDIFLYNEQLEENKRKMLVMERDKLRYQLNALKSQIDPHFLFNSLNVLSSLAYHDANKTNLFAKKNC